MAILSFDKDELVEYIPVSQREDENPCIVKMKFVPYGRVKKYAEMIARKTKGIRDESKLNDIRAEVQKIQFCDNVFSIENFSTKSGPVTEAADFYELADTALIYEIIEAMENSAKLTEGQKQDFLYASGGVSSPPKAPLSPAQTVQTMTEKVETVKTGTNYSIR